MKGRGLRKKDREVTNKQEIIQIIEKCDICRIAFLDNNIPYIVPMNFGYRYDTDELVLYFHCAREGKKLDVIKKNNIVCFEMDCSHNLIPSNIACKYTMEFESIIGNGVIEIVDIDRDKLTALNYIMKKYSNKKDFLFDKKKVKLTTILRLSVTDYSGKRLKRAFI